MRLHTLSITAFGPFGDTVPVDFDALGSAGLFLFSGPTGAGKTSILDAVCFALYGQVPGARQASRSLRSDHAAEGLAPEVVLELTIRGRRLRITRSPAWERPKRRGDGTTTEQARVLVQEWCDGEWLARAPRLDEAGQLIGDLLGLSMAQFCQVVLLPQGQFAEFLRSDPDKRRALLETLFDTRRFAQVEAWLVARRQETSRALAEADADLREQLARVCEAAGAEVPADLRLEAAPAWVQSLQYAAETDRCRAAEAHRRATLAWEQAATAVSTAQQRIDRAQRRAALEARRDELAEHAAEHARQAAELRAARIVAPLLPLVEQVARATAELAELDARVTHQTVVTGLAATGTDGLATVRSQARDAVQEAARLTELVAAEEEADRLGQEAEELKRALLGLATRADEVQQWLEAADQTRAQLAGALTEAREASVEAVRLRAEHSGLTRQWEAAQERDVLARELADAERVLQEAVDAHQQAREVELSTREARLTGIAAELAAALVPGEDCPVCGSREHPRKAARAATATTEADEERAADRSAQAEARRSAASTRRNDLQVRLAATRTAAGGDVAQAHLAITVTALAQALAAAEARAESLPAKEQALKDFDEQHERYRQEQVALAQELSALRTQESGHRQRAGELAQRVAHARGEDSTIASRLRRVQQQARHLSTLAELVADRERVRAAWSQSRAQLHEALREHGVDGVEEVRAHSRPPAAVEALEETVQQYVTEVAAVTEQLADPALALDPAAAPDLSLLREVACAAEERRDECTRTLQSAQSRMDALARLGERVSAAVERRRPVAEAHRVVDGLSRLAEGKSADNRVRMSLSAYVLAARLEGVAAAASLRLQRMTSGRYTLLHCVEATSGRSRGGLSLRVLDAWTGRERDPASLSGGETFSASLALALGLADVVTAEAGGALLDTLFVDEGFGTLDDETLDEVMSVLDDLREGGRTVGIVSHVADLRQRIPTQLRVVKGRTGSTVAC